MREGARLGQLAVGLLSDSSATGFKQEATSKTPKREGINCFSTTKQESIAKSKVPTTKCEL